MTELVTFTLNDQAFVLFMRENVDGLKRLVEMAAIDLGVQAQLEGSQIGAGRLGAQWPIEMHGSYADVIAPEWWAHFVARGTADHGPRVADRLMFEVDGTFVAAQWVRGLAPNPFDMRAIAATESRLDATLAKVLP